MRATRDSWRNRLPPENKIQIPYQRRFSKRQYEKLKKGLIPRQMEDKWFIYHEGKTLYFHRSWTGTYIYEILFVKKRNEWVVEQALVNDDPKQYRHKDPKHDAQLLGFLISNLLLGENKPFPLPKEMEAKELKGVYQHQVAGTGYPEKKH